MTRSRLTRGAAAAAAALALSPAAALGQEPPQTGFEQRNGTAWTTHDEELEFLAAIDAASERVSVETIGTTAQDRPLQLVRLGSPAPKDAATVRAQPSALLVCSQHGNEPAGREACLKMIRDLAYTKDAGRVALLQRANVLVVPAANPDGRARNSRTNTAGVDINRDHIRLVSPEAQAIAGVVRDYEPDISLDLHEYGPSLPAVYDDEILYLWPRNLNADQDVHDHAVELGHEIEREAESAGYSADEYGQYSLAEQDIHQSAGDHDEGIMRNAMGLRHSLGILVETAVMADPKNGLGGVEEVIVDGALELRRVAAHSTVVTTVLDELASKGETFAEVQHTAQQEAPFDTRPVYFDGADNKAPTSFIAAPCSYRLTTAQYEQVSLTLALLGIAAEVDGTGATVPMAQASEPLVPLVLDGRGARNSVDGTAQDC